MSSRVAFWVAALAAGMAICQAPGLVAGAHAQEVKEQWNISTPPPAPDANKNQPGEGGKPGAQPAAGAPGPVGSKNAQGLTIVKNPYTNDAAAIAQGKEMFVSYACSGCHGAGGGGGMCPPVINSTWVYGGDDTTLFNLIKLGSVELRAKGYARTGHENIVGDMPPFGSLLTPDQEWKLIAYVHSQYKGDAADRHW